MLHCLFKPVAFGKFFYIKAYLEIYSCSQIMKDFIYFIVILQNCTIAVRDITQLCVLQNDA